MRARVIVTFLPEEVGPKTEAADKKHRMLEVLRSWQEEEPLSPEEEAVLDGFEQFQAENPLRLARLDDEP